MKEFIVENFDWIIVVTVLMQVIIAVEVSQARSGQEKTQGLLEKILDEMKKPKA